MVIVFGSINVDFIGQVPKLPGPGETIMGHRLIIAPGGKGANQALAARRAGAKVQLVGAVGEDQSAPIALALLSAEGVDLGGVAKADDHTGCALILVEQSGENSIAVLPGANRSAKAAQLRDYRIGAGDVLVLQQEIPADEVREAAADARRRGATVILNCAPFRPADRSLLDAVSILIANENEATALAAHIFGREVDAQAAMPMLAKEFKLKGILTAGAQGSALFEGDRTTHVGALPVAAIDTVGAGDTYVGVLAASIEAGETLLSAMQHASVAASLACTASGAQPAMPDRDAILRELGKYRAAMTPSHTSVTE